MKKIAFLIPHHIDLTFIITYFFQYKVDVGNQILDKNHMIPGSIGNPPIDVYSNCLKYQYNDVEIDVFRETGFEIKDYDKVYEFASYQRGHVYNNTNSEKYEKILLNIGERTSPVDAVNSELNGIKMISGSKCNVKNVFYDFKFNLIYFYYFFGFNYLRFKYRDVSKENLLGMYWSPGYKESRDLQVDKIKKISNFNIDFYSLDKKKLSDYEWWSILSSDNWHRNHISSWTDYETSAVGYIFETLHHTTDFESIHRLEYIGEKTLKGLLFSFLRMPFILDCNPYSFIDLTKDGYWFLNSDYFKYNEEDTHEILIEKFSKGIHETISYLSHLNATHLGDLKKVSSSLYLENKEKIDKNFEKIMNDVYYPSNGESLLNFILE